MSHYPLASKTGVTKRAIKKATANGISEEDIFEFIHGDINKIQDKLPKPSGYQTWDSSGKRFVHLEEVRFVTKHFLRNAIKPESRRALILSGADPVLACTPWAMSGLVTKFTACELNNYLFTTAKRSLPKEIRKVKSLLPKDRKFEINLVLGNIFKETDCKYGVIDLDFCSNRIRTKEHRNNILGLLDHVGPNLGPFVLRITLHVGRVGNSKRDVEQHIDLFKEELRSPEQGYQKYRTRAHDMSPYQSSLPMISLVWILERQHDHKEYIGETE